MPNARYLRFSLRTAVVAFTLLCVGLALVGRQMLAARQQKTVVTALTKAGVHVDYVMSPSDISNWQLRLLGLDYFSGVEGVLISEANNVKLPDGPDPLIAIASKLSPIERVRIECCSLTAESLSPLEQHNEIEWISLWHTNATDKHIAMFRNMPLLRILDLRQTEITDDSVEMLTGFTKLELLLVTDTGISEGGVAKLRQALPDCDINTQ
jgi:hypothetical protein